MLELTGLAKGRKILARNYSKTKLDKNIQRQIAVLCYKLINLGEQLTTLKLDKIFFTICMKHFDKGSRFPPLRNLEFWGKGGKSRVLVCDL